MKKKTSFQSHVPLERITAVYLACMLSVFLLFPCLSGYGQITSHKWVLKKYSDTTFDFRPLGE